MRILKFLLVVPVIAIMLSASPVYAGKDKTLSAWNKQLKVITSSITDESALGKVEELAEKMADSYYALNKGKYYKLAAEMFEALTVLSKQNGGDNIKTPHWLH